MNELTATNRIISQIPAKPVPDSAVPKAAPKRRPAPATGGQAVPPSGKPKPVETQVIETKAAVEQLNQYLKDSHRSLVFETSKEFGRTIIRVVNPVTKEVIREIPPDATRVMASALQSGNFSLIDKLV